MGTLLLLAMMQAAPDTLRLNIPVEIPQPTVVVEGDTTVVDVDVFMAMDTVWYQMAADRAARNVTERASQEDDKGFFGHVGGVLNSRAFQTVAIIGAAWWIGKKLDDQNHTVNVENDIEVDCPECGTTVIVQPPDHDHDHWVPPGHREDKGKKPGG